MSDTQRLVDAALAYAGAGFAVLPLYEPLGETCACSATRCENVGKHPRVQTGVDGASLNAEAIRGWWSRWPKANLGIATGETTSLAVIDIDPRNGGDTEFESLRQDRRLPETAVVFTSSGGRHLYFRCGPQGCPSAKLAAGVDLKANRGYVVGPPSVHATGVTYQWEQSVDLNADIAPLPPWIRRLVPDTRATEPREAPQESISRRPLSNRIHDLLAHGDQSRAYASRSEVIQAIAAGAFRTGWSEDDLHAALRDKRNRGGKKVQEMRPDAARRYVSRSWAKSQQLPARDPNAATDAAVRLLLDDVERCIDETPFSGNAGVTDRQVVKVALNIARSLGRVEIDLSGRQAAELAGCDRKTAARALQRLTLAGLLVVVRSAHDGRPARYRLMSHRGDTQDTAPADRDGF